MRISDIKRLFCRLVAGIALTVSLFVGYPALSHHSNAMFDQDKLLELQGTVVEFQFTNPHTWLQVDVENESGETVEWSIEWGSPNNLGRQGIRPSTFPPGAAITVRTYPMKDGSPGGLFLGARLADDRTFGRWE